jgi:hypothetical protein
MRLNEAQAVLIFGFYPNIVRGIEDYTDTGFIFKLTPSGDESALT